MSKKKYYFGDRLVRTSDRTYSHVVMRGDDVLSCCGISVSYWKQSVSDQKS